MVLERISDTRASRQTPDAPPQFEQAPTRNGRNSQPPHNHRAPRGSEDGSAVEAALRPSARIPELPPNPRDYLRTIVVVTDPRRAGRLLAIVCPDRIRCRPNPNEFVYLN